MVKKNLPELGQETSDLHLGFIECALVRHGMKGQVVNAVMSLAHRQVKSSAKLRLPIEEMRNGPSAYV